MLRIRTRINVPIKTNHQWLTIDRSGSIKAWFNEPYRESGCWIYPGEQPLDCGGIDILDGFIIEWENEPLLIEQGINELDFYVAIPIDHWETTKHCYLLLQEACNFKAGERVRILRKAESHELGWPNAWVREMTELVGTVATVIEVVDGGVRLLDDDKDTNYCYPFFVLERVK